MRLTCVTDFLNLQHLFVCFSGGSDGSGVLSSPVQVWTNLLLSAKGHRLPWKITLAAAFPALDSSVSKTSGEQKKWRVTGTLDFCTTCPTTHGGSTTQIRSRRKDSTEGPRTVAFNMLDLSRQQFHRCPQHIRWHPRRARHCSRWDALGGGAGTGSFCS